MGEETDNDVSMELFVVFVVRDCDGLSVNGAADFNFELRCHLSQACKHDWCNFLGGNVSVWVYVRDMACVCLVST